MRRMRRSTALSDMVNCFNGVPIPKPATFDEDLEDTRANRTP